MNYEELKRLDHTYLWHPFTQMQEWMGEEPCIISQGDGHYLVDVHGSKVSGWSFVALVQCSRTSKKRAGRCRQRRSSIASLIPLFSV